MNFEDFFNEVSTITNEPLSIKRFAGGTFPPGGTSAKGQEGKLQVQAGRTKDLLECFLHETFETSYARQTQLS